MVHLFKPNSEKTHKILLAVKGGLATLAISNFATNNDKLGFYLLLSAGLIDIIVTAMDDGKN